MRNIKQLLDSSSPLTMGILNVTPDSFSDGGQHDTVKKALKRAEEMESEGADIIDIGGESTGPNSKYVPPNEELKRVIPVLKALRKKTSIPISIDTYKSQIAREALENGADIINDVTALRGDTSMAKIVAKYKCPIILMYSKDKTPRTTVQKKHYKDVIKTIKSFLLARIRYAQKKGIKKSQIIIDPGMGNFISAIPKYSYEIISRMSELQKLKLPILLGASRKSFLGGTFKDRDTASVAIAGIAYLNGASIIRTHNVSATKEFFKNFSL
ncbi:MAG: dihydropteroate synthase [Candidatus Peregrinibacteria bacterium]